MSMIQEDIFPWNKKFETGIVLIDEQHQILITLVNKVAKHFIQCSNPSDIYQVLNELSDYTLYHFQSEEKIWHEFLPHEQETLKHQQIHKAFIDRIINFRENKAFPDEKTTHELFSFLTHWLSFHILDTDRQMANIVLAIQEGHTLMNAKQLAQDKTNHSTELLISTVLNMYDRLSSKTLKLMREISKRQHAEQRSRVLQQAIDSSLEAIFITDKEGMIVDANPAFCQYVNQTWENLSTCQRHQLHSLFVEQKNLQQAWKHTDKHGHWAGEIRTINAQGIQEITWLSLSSISNENGVITHYSGVLSSASPLIKQKNFLEVEVNYDALTRLPNRRLFHERLKQAISNCERNKTQLAVCFLDLDGFKDVNDTYGHDAGDQVLCTVSRNIEHTIRKTDSVARMGGDEFAILLEALNDRDNIIAILQKVIQSIQKPIAITSNPVNVSASIGVAIYPHDSLTPKGLLKKADQAMYMAKNTGKSCIISYQKEDMI